MALSEREVKKVLKEVGCTLLTMRKTRHLRVVTRHDATGVEFLTIFPQSPSCHHWRENKLHELRLIIAERVAKADI